AAADTLCARFPDDHASWTTSYQVHALAGENAEAAVALTVAGYLRPLGRAEALTLGDLYFFLNVPTLSGRYYEAALGDSAGVDDYERLSSAWLAARDERRAAEVLDRGLARFPSPRLWSLLGDLRVMQDDQERAYAAYRESAALDPGSGRVQLMLGWSALETGRAAEAIAALERAAADSVHSRTVAPLLERARRSIKF
ncbi:tetratricopeptide repeat protein, partial [bacterium]|nr:tetratricopeptide repeat protein [bacterium]